jgi:hypothetical protein
VGALVLGALSIAWPVACSTTETVALSDGDCVAGGCANISGASSAGATTSSSSGGACTVNQACATSWATDVFAGILDKPNGCTSAGLCHGNNGGNVTIAPGDAHAAYVTLTAYTLLAQPGPAKKFIVPCDKDDSGMLCNMKEDGSTNPFGQCGSGMPLTGTDLTIDQLNTIADWIACGAPEN